MKKINKLPNVLILRQEINDWIILNSLEICSINPLSFKMHCDIKSHISIISKTEDLFIDSASRGIILDKREIHLLATDREYLIMPKSHL